MKERIIFHIDVNSAYLSWEAVERLKKGDKLDIRTIPSVVSGSKESRRGVVLAKSYPCKKYNIISGEPLYVAQRKCKNLLIVEPNMDLYKKCSDNMFKIISEYSDRVERYSIDECFLDYTGMENLLGDRLQIADEIRKRIEEELGFTVCVGISDVKVLAKMATELRKPNYTNTLYKNELEKIWNLDISNLFMAGKSTVLKLRKYNINTIGELARSDLKFIKERFNKQGEKIWEYANGIDNSKVGDVRKGSRSVGHSTTFKNDINDMEEIKKTMLWLCDKTSRRLRQMGEKCDRVKVEYKDNNFKMYTMQRKLENETSSSNIIYNASMRIGEELFKKVNCKVRMVGVSVVILEEVNGEQLTLLDMKREKDNRIDKLLDSIKNKYGENAITRATFLESKNNRIRK